MPTLNTAYFQTFLCVLVQKITHQNILLVLDGALNHRYGDLVVSRKITLLFLPPYWPELYSKENLWNEICEKIFKNCALKSMTAVQAILDMERNPEPVHPLPCSPISSSHSDAGSV